MAAVGPPDRESDPFAPPAVPTRVACLHCGQEYDSSRIEWRAEKTPDGNAQGFWCCPIPGCGGLGFGCDILPVDPNYRDEFGGWIHDGESEEDDLEDDFREDLAPPPDGEAKPRPDGEDPLPW